MMNVPMKHATDAIPQQIDHVTTVDPFGLRLLVIGWCLWLLVSWSVTLAMSVPVYAVRWVVFSATFGIMAVWPALRLSESLPWRIKPNDTDASESASVCGDAAQISRTDVLLCMFATGMDWVSLVVVFQVVIWPLMLVGQWSFYQTLWLDLAVSSWALLTGVLVALGRIMPMALARIGAMMMCMLLLVGEPIWMALGSGHLTNPTMVAEGRQMRISPIQALWELTTTKQHEDPFVWIPVILSIALAACLAWIMLGMMAWWTRKT